MHPGAHRSRGLDGHPLPGDGQVGLSYPGPAGIFAGTLLFNTRPTACGWLGINGSPAACAGSRRRRPARRATRSARRAGTCGPAETSTPPRSAGRPHCDSGSRQRGCRSNRYNSSSNWGASLHTTTVMFSRRAGSWLARERFGSASPRLSPMRAYLRPSLVCSTKPLWRRFSCIGVKVGSCSLPSFVLWKFHVKCAWRLTGMCSQKVKGKWVYPK